MDLPSGHWMHAALAKEKARIAKKTAAKGDKAQPDKGPAKAGEVVTAPAGAPMKDKGDWNGSAC